MLNDKKLNKIEKILGKDTLNHLDSCPTDILKDTIVGSEHSINEAVRELEANPKYSELKESVKALSEGLREIKKRQNAIIQYALSLLEDRGDK
jgi:hypothetical protein